MSQEEENAGETKNQKLDKEKSVVIDPPDLEDTEEANRPKLDKGKGVMIGPPDLEAYSAAPFLGPLTSNPLNISAGVNKRGSGWWDDVSSNPRHASLQILPSQTSISESYSDERRVASSGSA